MRVLYFLLLLGWFGIGTCLSKKHLCGEEAKPTVTAAPIEGDCDYTISFQDGELNVSSKSNFTFGGSRYKFKSLPSDELTSALSEVAAYLASNEERALFIEGLYLDKEKNTSDLDNLGLARATTIKDYLVKDFEINADQIMLSSTVEESVCYDTKTKTVNKGSRIGFAAIK